MVGRKNVHLKRKTKGQTEGQTDINVDALCIKKEEN